MKPNFRPLRRFAAVPLLAIGLLFIYVAKACHHVSEACYHVAEACHRCSKHLLRDLPRKNHHL